MFASTVDAKKLVTCFEEKCRDEAACEIQVDEVNGCFGGQLAASLAPACAAAVTLRRKYSRYATTAAVAIDPSKNYEPVFLAQATCMPGKLVMPLIGV